MQEGGVAFVAGWLQKAGEGGDGEDVGGIEGAAEEHTGGVGEGEEDGGGWALEALGELLRKALEEGVLVVDLAKGQICRFYRCTGGKCTITLVFTSTVTMASL